MHHCRARWGERCAPRPTVPIQRAWGHNRQRQNPLNWSVRVITLEPIGVVRSPVSEGRDEDWGEVISEIHTKDELAAGLQGLEEFSHLVVLFWMHQSSFSKASDLIRRPRGRQ